MPSEGEEYDVDNIINGVFSEEFKKYAREEDTDFCFFASGTREREMEDTSIRNRNEFYKYVTEQKYVAKRSPLHDEDKGIGILEYEHADSLTSTVYRRLVDELIRPLETNFGGKLGCLIQFWRAEEERVVNNNSVGERRFLLTLRNQPFLLKDRYLLFQSNLCGYRTKMHDVIVNGDERGGPIGRVFRNNRMEFTPYVSYYSDNEYPQRDIAISCGVSSSLVFPWCNYHGSVVGAIEIVSLHGLPLLYRLTSNPLCSNSLYPDYCIRLCGQYDSEKDSLISAVTEINEVIGENCNLCQNISSTTQQIPFFLKYEDLYNLQKGEGVVGKAAESSHDLVYCENVAKLSITEYPLSHFARNSGLSASFAIRLKSNRTGDQVYVLEFFLHPYYVKGKNLRATLVPILEAMKQRFKTIKFASGGEIGDSLSVQVIKDNPENNETCKIGGLYLMDNHLASADSIENGGYMASNPNEREYVITALMEKLHNAQKLGDRGRELAIGVTHADILQKPLLVANFVSSSRECIMNSVKLSEEKKKAVMQQRLISHDGTDVSRFFPEDFKKYAYEENLLCRNIKRHCWVFSKEHESGVVGYSLGDLIDGNFKLRDICYGDCLVQYWIAEERGDFSERHVQFESRNQPFLLVGSDTYDRICTYRTKMSNRIIGNGGVIGRVYRNNRMEYNLDIDYYSSEEYPNQDLAWYCGVKSSLVSPLCDLFGRPVGVCELVSPESIFPSEDLIRDLSTYPVCPLPDL